MATTRRTRHVSCIQLRSSVREQEQLSQSKSAEQRDRSSSEPFGYVEVKIGYTVQHLQVYIHLGDLNLS